MVDKAVKIVKDRNTEFKLWPIIRLPLTLGSLGDCSEARLGFSNTPVQELRLTTTRLSLLLHSQDF